jgi:hypothetical protein
MRDFKGYLNAFFIIILVMGSIARATKYKETTTGKTEEDYATYGGVSKAERDAMKKSQKDAYDRFTQGRVSSKYNGASRYSGFLELHDEKFRAVTDHPTGSGENIEGKTERATFQRTLQGAERSYEIDGDVPSGKKDVDRQVNNSGNCEKGYIKGVLDENHEKVPCRNVSASLLDAGNAHGRADDAHRAYKLLDTVVDASKEAGKAYAKRGIKEASELDVKKENLANYQNVGRDKSKIRVKKADGSWSQDIDVAASIDFMQSDASWLEEQKKLRLTNTWRAMRATRLANGKRRSTMDVDGELAEMVGDPKFSDADIAKRVVERSIFTYPRYTYWVLNKSQLLDTGPALPPGTNTLGCTPKTPAPPLPTEDNSFTNCETLDLFMTRDGTAETKSALWQKALAKYKKDKATEFKADEDKAAKAEPQAEECMKREVWCTSTGEKRLLIMAEYKKKANGAAIPAGSPLDQEMQKKLATVDKEEQQGKFFSKVSDPGEAISDTRELTTINILHAMEGSLDKYMGTARNLDFNESNVDRQIAGASNKPYEELKQQVENAQKARDALIDYEQQREQAGDGSYQSAFLKSNPKNSNTTKIFARDPTKLGDTLLTGSPMPSGVADYTKEAIRAPALAPSAPQSAGGLTPNN